MFISTICRLIKNLRSIWLAIICILFSTYAKAQNAPYPYQPVNTNTVNTETPILKWNGSTQFAYYKVEIFDCTYYEGSSFNSVELEDYTLTYYENDRPGYESSALTNHEMRGGDYITIDDAGTEIISYVNGFNSIVSVPVNSSGSDFEGITYLSVSYTHLTLPTTPYV